MRIALFDDAVERGGAERYFRDLAAGLAEAGHEIHVVLSAREGAQQQISALAPVAASITRLSAGIQPAWAAFTAYLGAWLYLARLRPHVAHFSLHHADSCRYWIEAACRLDVPFLLSEHLVTEGYLRASRLTYRFKTRSYRKARAVLFCAETALSRALASWRGEPPRIVVVPHGVHIDEFSSSIERNGMRVCFVGRLSMQKDPLAAVQAFESVAADFPEATLNIHGDGPLRHLVAEEIARSRAADRIVLCGYTERIAHALARADILLLPSRAENLPYAVLEAMASGCAVIATSVGDLPAVLDGGAGVIVAPGDMLAIASALRGFLADRSASLQAGARGRQRIEALYTFDRMIQTILRLYDEAVNHSSDQQKGEFSR